MNTYLTLFLSSALSFSLLACSTAEPKKAYAGPVLPIAQIDRCVHIVLPDNVLFESGKSVLNLAGHRLIWSALPS